MVLKVCLNPPDCPILWNWTFDNLILADGLSAKALQTLETCVLINNNICQKLLGSSSLLSSLGSPKTFDISLKVTLAPFLSLILVHEDAN